MAVYSENVIKLSVVCGILFYYHCIAGSEVKNKTLELSALEALKLCTAKLCAIVRCQVMEFDLIFF